MTTAPADPLIDRLIDGRYEVRSRIARGGMATVYVATDLRLDRRVAIKIMHGHLADDDAFRERFVQEARSAARLAHPNVVSVFDQGQDSEMAYMVMEYLPGMTLRDLLKDYGRLTTEQTLDIMEAVLGGLAAAHKAGIVHRDVKPENVLLADDGRIKIGDFGLARAASANTATGQALLGTIAYLSPELLTRGIADARSDIYASGIMMYEMLVGEQPYKGEQPMQIAFQHANETVPAPSLANPAVPAEIDDLVLWATSKNPAERPADAREMLDQLYEAEQVTSESVQATMQVLRSTAFDPELETAVMPTRMYDARVGDGFGAEVDDDQHGRAAQNARDARGAAEAETQVLRPGRRSGAARVRGLFGATSAAGAGAGAGAGASDTTTAYAGGAIGLLGSSAAAVTAPTAPTTPAAPARPAPGEQAPQRGGKTPPGGRPRRPTRAERAATPPSQRLVSRAATRRRRGWWAFAVVVVLLVGAAGAGWYFSSGPGGQLTIPAVSGESPDAAAAALAELGLTVGQGTGTSPTVPVGTVLGTDPDQGSSVLNGSNVTVIVSTGPAQLPVPALVGQPEDAARQSITQSGFTSTDSQTEFSSTVAAGTVIQSLGGDGQSLGATYGEQQPVTLLVSLGAVPNTVGKTADEANTALVAVGLVSAVGSESYSDTVPAGTVISYALPADPIKPGTGATVSLEVSKGPAPVDVPDVQGKSWTDAKKVLVAAGFVLAYNQIADTLPDAFKVSATDPAPGTSVPRGSKVIVSFSVF